MKTTIQFLTLLCGVILSALALSACDDHPAPSTPPPAPEPIMRPNS